MSPVCPGTGSGVFAWDRRPATIRQRADSKHGKQTGVTGSFGKSGSAFPVCSTPGLCYTGVMRKTMLMLLFIMVPAGWAMPVKPTATVRLTVRVTGVRPGGTVRLALFRAEAGFPGDHTRAFRRLSHAVAGDTMELVLQGLPHGSYAVAVHHDANANGKMETDLLGRPREGWGVSNNLPLRTFGPPRYRDARIILNPGMTTTEIRLRY